MNSKLISYAMDFASFLVQNMKDTSTLQTIILYGSVAREEATTTSDIDLFIDVPREQKNTEQSIQKILEQYLSSAKNLNYWKPLGIHNEIKLTIGELKKWKELQPSIASNGITLYGKYKSESITGKHTTFFIWENVQPNTKRVLFNKKLYGYTKNKKHYTGLLEQFHGQRLGKGCITVPIEHANTIHQHFKKNRVSVIIKKTIEY